MDPALIVGLGNPGPEYAATRHNLGFMVLDALAGRIGATYKAHKAGTVIAGGTLAGRRVVLVKPRTYMNVSGPPIAATARFFTIPRTDIVVVHDDLDLPFGAVRVKRGGGEGGHNGLRSVSTALGGKDYLRVRLGIGRPPGRMDPADYVLRRFSAAEATELGVTIETAADATESLLTDGLEATQNRFHPGRPAVTESRPAPP